MATIGEVVLKITPAPQQGMMRIEVDYVVTGSGHDKETEQHYREVCHLISLDGNQESAIPGGTVSDRDIVFIVGDQESAIPGGDIGGSFTRAEEIVLLRSALNEDFLSRDEIRAVVTLTPIPTRRRSSTVVI